MDNLLAWSDQLRVELDIGTAHRDAQVESLLSANREMSVRVDQLQDKFDHFIDEHWRPMQHFACGVVSCLAVFTGDSSFEPPFAHLPVLPPIVTFPPIVVRIMGVDRAPCRLFLTRRGAKAAIRRRIPLLILHVNGRLPGTGSNGYVWNPNGCSGRW